MAIDFDQIRNNYANFDNFKIEHLAKNEAGFIEPEVIPILIEEINKRGLDPDLIKGIEAQTKEITEIELNELKTKIKNLPCPDCGSKGSPLIGSLIRTVKSFFVITISKKTSIITCKSCADKRMKNALISTFLLGWWGFPFGIFKTPIAIIASMMDKNKKDKISDGIITVFAIENIGEIRTNWDKENELVNFIGHVNSSN
ncbi:MAG: hypothetical protein UT04_C0032G0013 [Candidatus Daviesbacteria bacterium GW2011_GWF2_38_7]|nr:MAG: hypothetical protein UT04_C0032G0013 [Candidatus Daviesbacteria bacterium GW2011_GWF2_38_7]